jgi:hypothetical protein
MRAKEFIGEDKKGKITKRQGMSAVGVGTFRDPKYADRIYTLNRVMMTVACVDGTDESLQNLPDTESWSGREDTYHPYTKVEDDMLKQAFKHTGAPYRDLAKGDLRSQELSDTNKSSPVQGFKGYGKKSKNG